MKKLLLLFTALLFVVSSYAQVMWYQTTGFKQATVYNGRYTWPSQWEPSNMKLSIDTDNSIITIYSPQALIYTIYDSYNNGQPYNDNNGGKQIKFFAVDQDYDKCTVRLRIENSGNSLIYIDFSNVAWVYNIIRIQ